MLIGNPIKHEISNADNETQGKEILYQIVQY